MKELEPPINDWKGTVHKDPRGAIRGEFYKIVHYGSYSKKMTVIPCNGYWLASTIQGSFWPYKFDTDEDAALFCEAKWAETLETIELIRYDIGRNDKQRKKHSKKRLLLR